MSYPDPLILAAIAAYVTLFWLVSLRLRDAGIMDIGWGPGFVLAVGVAIWLHGEGPRTGIVLACTALWAFRLAWHIGRRNIGHAEDARYARWRAEAGPSWWWRSWFKVFALQGAILWLVSWPLQAAATTAADVGWLTGLGIVVWLIGFAIETVADRQLAAFKQARKSGQIDSVLLDTGLWRYSRHPNYFGEAVLWVGFGLMAVDIAPTVVLSVALMVWLLVRVSGVAMLDKLLAETKPGYAEYMRRTPGFVPGRPRV